MKKRGILILLALIILFVINTKYSGAVKSFFLDLINPIKNAYHNFSDMGDSYIHQHQLVLSLKRENSELKKLLIEQSHYIKQLSEVYHLLPSLEKKPYKSIYLVNTISYVKLNRLDEILLTTPKELEMKQKQLYGLIQEDVAAGIVQNIDGKFYGYLLSHPKCTFGVSIGSKEIHGIAQGDNKKGMIVKFIPRWSKVTIGDVVKTSGLDNIFFPDIPVGVVVDVKTLDQYKQAKIRIYANIAKPETFFLISNPAPYLTTDYQPKNAFPNKVYPYIPIDAQNNENNSSADQTKENIVEPSLIKEEEKQQIIDYGSLLNNTLQFNKKY